MSEHYREFLRLIEEVRAGSEDAIRELVDIYGHHVYRIVRYRLNRELRSQYDSQDFCQSVWASFFANRDAIIRFKRPEELAALNGLSSTCRGKQSQGPMVE